jgi:glyoxylase-like metal-dependent hydrolase (beta-lactamase superfamily II)
MTNFVNFTIINIGTLSVNKYWGETERLRQPTATCTLLSMNTTNLLVDPSPHPPELKKILFANSGLTPDKIDIVFLTHFHGDHMFGIDLFPNAKWLMAEAGLEEWMVTSHDKQPLIERFQKAEGNLPDEINLISSPGHTMGLHTLNVLTKWGILNIAGDAVMTSDYFDNEEGYSNSKDFSLATKTIQSIKKTASLVIPGHGNLILNMRIE